MAHETPLRSSRRGWTLLVTVALAAALITGMVPGIPAPAARADDVTASQNDLRDGWDQGETGLTPAVLASGTFGQLFSTEVDGQVYAQPVVVGNTVIVATENDWIYGLNAASGTIEWSRQLGAPWPSSAEGCSDLAPNVGVTGTPVYNPATGTVYMVSQEVPTGNSVYNPEFFMHAINPQTGAERPGWPVPIQGSPANDPGRPFNPFTELQRPGLLLLGGSVYAAFGSHCDFTPYAGYVAGVNTSTRALTLWSDEAGLTDNQGGIWQSGGGLMSDGPGRIFLATGNGVSPAPGPGTNPPPELGDAVVRLGVQSNGTLQAGDFFSPANAPSLDATDTDFGAGGPVGLPFGSGAYPHLQVQAGKDGRLFVLNDDDLGGREQGPGDTDDDVSQSGPYGGQWGHPAAFGDTPALTTGNAASSADYVYYLGANDYLRVLKLGLNSAGRPALADVANSASTFGYTSGSPVVTSNGTSRASAVVWVVGAAGGNGARGTLEAFDAVPPANCSSAKPCALSPIWSAPIGTASKFAIPATDAGRVYVGTRDGTVVGFGSPSKAPLTASPVSFGHVSVGGTAGSATVTAGATGAVTVTGVTASSAGTPDPFSTGKVTRTHGGVTTPVTFPVSLAAGDTLHVPVTMTPRQPGGLSGFLGFATNSANFPTVSVPLTGDGVEAGLFATASTLSFSTVAGLKPATSVDIANWGATAETIQSATAPAGPFSAAGLPAAGTTLGPGQSIVVTVTFQPPAAGTFSSSFVIHGSAGSATVALTGKATAGLSRMSPSARPVSFGSVPLGQQHTATLDITNAGNLPASVQSASVLGAPFGTPAPVTAGLPLNPGYDLKIPLTFTPSSTGVVTSNYRFTWTDTLGTHTLSVPVTATGVAAAAGQQAVSPPGGGWTSNGSSRMSGTSLVLTPAAADTAGSAVYPVPEPSSSLHVSFTASLGGGTGGDGLTFSLLNAATEGPNALGGDGADLGFGGLSGVAVGLDTQKGTGDPSDNFIGISTGATGGHLNYLATASNVPALRTGTHQVGITVSGGTITVTVDGKQYLSAKVTLPPSVLLAFTGATGGATDQHTVSGVSITAGGGAVPPPGGGWSYNAAAGLSGSDSVLTPATATVAGSVVYPTPLTVSGLSATFDAQLNGGTGADGLTVSLLAPASSSATSVGGAGAGLGFGGLTGIAVTLVTHQDTGYPAGNFIGISTGLTNPGQLGFQSFAQGIAPLRDGTHTVGIKVVRSNGTDVLVVTLDGQQVLQSAEPLLAKWGTARLAFTAGTGALTDVHIVRDVAISTAS
jgi:Abnormal spindle-like microcephaly-assoc'd, ASPM-SPD-2-Hydin/HYDIN/CFA65/VesB-like, Ig-like domain/PQQ-like domain